MTKRVDLLLLWSVLGLSGLGLVMVYSASAVFSDQRYGDPTHFLFAQGVALGVGLCAMLITSSIDADKLRVVAPLALLTAITLLALIFAPGLGHTAGGATRWVKIGPLTFQPSEIAKPAVILYLAWSLSRKTDRIQAFGPGFVGPGILAGIPIVMILLQPDFGTAVTLTMVVCALLFLAGTKLRYLLFSAALGIPFAVYLVVATPYRLRRVLAFLDPWAMRHDAGYQIAESLISIGSGGLTGLGLGDGRQKLFFLPEAHTDFIFSIIAEELGLIGAIVVIFLFALLIWRGMRAAYCASSRFTAYLAIGLTSMLGLQAVLNLAVAMGLLPTKGLTLPFISYGGTSLVLSLAAAGMLLSISSESGGFLRPAPGDLR